MKIGIHQPNYLPWSGFFYKLAKSDLFILLDDSQYSKNSYQNRVQVKCSTGSIWLTQPVKTSGNSFAKTKEIHFADSMWPRKHVKSLQSIYSRSDNYLFCEKLLNIIVDSSMETEFNLCSVNTKLIKCIANMLGINTPIISSSTIEVSSKSTSRLVELVKAVGGNEYIYGEGAINYQDDLLFIENGIGLNPLKFSHPIYPQLWGNFIPGLSIVDLLMNCGDKSLAIILNAN